MKILFWIFCFINIAALSGATSSICNTKWPMCDETIENIVCERKGNCTNEPGCEDIAPDTKFLKFILHEHNRLRNQIASGNATKGITGPAANMMALSYDKALEYTAKCNVNRCKFEHDKCRGTSKFKTAGQNLYYTSSSKDDLKNAVKSWYDEIQNMTDGVVNNFPEGRSDISNVTQLIWAKTTHVGCAMAQSVTSEKRVKFYITCNYGPAGNLVGQVVYERGPGCSKCPLSVKCNSIYQSICGDIDETEIDGDRYRDQIYDESTAPSPTIKTNTDLPSTADDITDLHSTKHIKNFGGKRALDDGEGVPINGSDGGIMRHESTVKAADITVNISDGNMTQNIITVNISDGNMTKNIIYDGSMTTESLINDRGIGNENFVKKRIVVVNRSTIHGAGITDGNFNESDNNGLNRNLVNESYLFDSNYAKRRKRKEGRANSNVTSFLISFCLPLLSWWSVM